MVGDILIWIRGLPSEFLPDKENGSKADFKACLSSEFLQVRGVLPGGSTETESIDKEDDFLVGLTRPLNLSQSPPHETRWLMAEVWSGGWLPMAEKGGLSQLKVRVLNLVVVVDVKVVKEGGMGCVKNLWDSAPPVQSLEVAAEVLRHLSTSGPIVEVLVAKGFDGKVIGVLNCEF